MMKGVFSFFSGNKASSAKADGVKQEKSKSKKDPKQDSSSAPPRKSRRRPPMVQRRAEEIKSPAEHVAKSNQKLLHTNTLLLGGVLVSALVLVMSIVSLFTELSRVPERTYFGAYSDGRLIELATVGTAHYSPEFVTKWLLDSMNETWNFHHLTWRQHLTDVTQHLFTDNGRKIFIEALKSVVNMRELEETRSSVALDWRSSPTLLQSGLRTRPDGTYFDAWDWIYRAAVTVEISNGELVSRTPMMMTVVVTRRGMRSGEIGLAIRSIVMVKPDPKDTQ